MAIFINETGRSFPNVDDGGEYKKDWNALGGDHESHAHHSGPGTTYRITFNEDGPGTSVFTKDGLYIGDNDEACFDPNGLVWNWMSVTILVNRSTVQRRKGS